MSLNDSTSDLDTRITAIVERNVGRLREELLHRVQQTETRLAALGQRLGGGQPAAAAPAAAAVAAPAAAPQAGTDQLDELFAVVVAIDRASTQQEVLAALLEGAGRFANRSALFLTHADSAQGWGSYGFENASGDFQRTVVTYGDGPLATLAEGRGCVPLDAGECAELCEQMGVAAGEEGLLVPFILRDRVAAALYVDRTAADPPLARRAVQLLTWDAAQAVEGLALRERSETPTLQMADEAAAAGVAMWEAEPAAEPAGDAAVIEPEPEPEEPIAAAALAEPEVEMEMETALETAPETEPEALAGAIEPETDWQEMDLGAAEPAAEEPETRPLEELAEPVAPEPVDETAAAGIAAAAAEPPAADTVAPAPPMAPPVGARAVPMGGGDSTMVQPPEDVAGPGWAFTASRGTTETGDEALHEEARRLARLLVTEIKLYNEEQVEEGRRSKDIYSRLKEDIDRSRQIFNERVDEEIRGETDYFQEEMVRILAGGDAAALGV